MSQSTAPATSTAAVTTLQPTDFAVVLARRTVQQQRLRAEAWASDRRTDLERYALHAILQRLFVVTTTDEDRNGANKCNARADALRIAMLARADAGDTHFDLSLGYDPLHDVTMQTIADEAHFRRASRFLIETVLRSRRMRLEYGDDRNRDARCSIGTRPYLRIFWDDVKVGSNATSDVFNDDVIDLTHTELRGWVKPHYQRNDVALELAPPTGVWYVDSAPKQSPTEANEATCPAAVTTTTTTTTTNSHVDAIPSYSKDDERSATDDRDAVGHVECGRSGNGDVGTGLQFTPDAPAPRSPSPSCCREIDWDTRPSVPTATTASESVWESTPPPPPPSSVATRSMPTPLAMATAAVEPDYRQFEMTNCDDDDARANDIHRCMTDHSGAFAWTQQRSSFATAAAPSVAPVTVALREEEDVAYF